MNSSVARLIELGSTPDSEEVRSALKELDALSCDFSTAGQGVSQIDSLPPVAYEDVPIDYIRDPELPRGAVIALTGDSGSGKSTLATAWARDAIEAGTHCLFLDRENPRAVIRDRMRRLGLEDSLLPKWFGGWLGDVATPDSAEVIAWVSASHSKPLIIVDSLIAFLRGDENDAAVMRAFTDKLRKLADMGATVITIHHDGKAETARDFRGSSDFKASFDQAFHVSNVGSDNKLDRLRLRCFKSRYGLTGIIFYNYAGGRLHRDVRPETPLRTVAEQLLE